MRNANNLPTLRFITSSSAPLTIEEWRRFEERFGIPIAQGYGSSETGWIAAVPGEQRRLGTVGRPFAYHRLAIVDADGRPLPAGEIGQVEIGGFASHDYRYLADDGSVKINSRGRIRTGDLGCSMPTVFSASPAARRTSSSAAASTSRRSRSTAS